MAQEELDLEPLIDEWQKKPELFMTEALDVSKEELWDKMLEIVESVRDNPFTAVKAAHGVSKSYTAARLVLWFLYCFGTKATVITTAPSHQQVEDVLWQEIRLAHSSAKIPLGGKPTKTRLELGEKWFAMGFATKPDTVTQQATSFQGKHNDYVLIIFDEAAGIMPEIWEAADSLMQGGKLVRFLAIGNPTSANGNFVDCFRSSLYNKITISVMDTPNYKQDRNVIPGLSGREFVEFVKQKYGEDSAYYKSRVLGEIPDEDVDALIPMSEVEKGINRIVTKFSFEKRFVVWDVADGGDDANQLYAFKNTEVLEEMTFHGKRVEEVEPYVWQLLKKIGGNTVIVDFDGVGRVASSLLNASNVNDEKISIIDFTGSAPAYEEEIFNSRKSEAAWELRMMTLREETTFPNDDELREELTNFKTDPYAKKGKICLEKKKDMKDRIGRSPNKGDCFVMMAGAWEEIKPVKKEHDKYLSSVIASRNEETYDWRAA